MKTTLLPLIFILFFAFSSMAQNCLPQGITFYSQADIDNFQTNYPACTHIEGDVTIGNDGYTTDINNLNGLSVLTAIDGFLYINTNEDLGSFSGLDAITMIGGYFFVDNNDLITDLSGLGSLSSIGGDFFLRENSNLTDFSGLSSLTTINGVFKMGYHENFASFNGLSNLTYVGGIDFSYLGNIQSLYGLGLTSIGGDVTIYTCNSLLNLNGLNLVTSINGNVFLNQNDALSTVLGLEALTSISGYLRFYDSPGMSSLTALSSLTQIGGDLIIGGCDMIQSLTGLETLTSIGGNLEIHGNQILNYLTGIENINPQSITNLTISYNPNLILCDIQSICNYLVSPGGNIIVMNNGGGCNSQTEIETACNAGINETKSSFEFFVYPNPASNMLTIDLNDNISILEMKVFNQLGQLELSSSSKNKTIDISQLEKGLFIMEIVTDKGVGRAKFIVE